MKIIHIYEMTLEAFDKISLSSVLGRERIIQHRPHSHTSHRCPWDNFQSVQLNQLIHGMVVSIENGNLEAISNHNLRGSLCNSSEGNEMQDDVS